MDNLKEATLQSELRFKDLIINPCHRSVLINNRLFVDERVAG